MTEPLRIAVADDDPSARDQFERCLARLGHQVVVSAEDGRQLVELCRESKPDLVITDLRMPSLTGLEAAEALCRAQAVPVIVVTAHDAEALADRAYAAGVLACLVKPVTEKNLAPAIDLAWRQFKLIRALCREIGDAKQALDDRKLIERAKGAVVRRVAVAEDDAYRRLREYASNHNLKLADAARTILEAEGMFHAFDEGRDSDQANPGRSMPAGPGLRSAARTGRANTRRLG